MKFLKFLFTLLWLLILLAAANIFIVAMKYSLSAEVALVANVATYVLMFVIWLLFPYTVAPILHITESPFKLFSLRCSTAFVGAFFALGFAAHL